MSGVPAPIDSSALPAPQTGGADASAPRPKSRYSLLTGRDKITLGLMVGIPTILCLSFIWLPTLASVLLSFTNWRGIQPITANNIVGFKNYEVLFTQYSLFWLTTPLSAWTMFAVPSGVYCLSRMRALARLLGRVRAETSA